MLFNEHRKCLFTTVKVRLQEVLTQETHSSELVTPIISHLA